MRGRVWFYDDFKAAALHWQPVSVGVGGAQHLVSDYVRNGEQALGLQANTGAGRQSNVFRVFQIPRNVSIGLEVSFAQEVNFGNLQMTIDLDDATQRTITSVRVDEATGQFQYQNDAGGWTNSGMLTGLDGELSHFHTIKSVFDYSTDEWLRLLYDDQETDLNREPTWTVGTLGLRRLVVRLINDGDNVNNARVCFDDFIITTMEPD
jgi:hypothetical protein